MSDNANQENKDSVNGSSERIKVKVVGLNIREIRFRVKMRMKLRKMKNRYSQLVRIPVSSLRFVYKGTPINDHDTPNQLNMEHGDEIQVYKVQTGGVSGAI